MSWLQLDERKLLIRVRHNRSYSPRKTNSWVFEAMIFEPKTDFSERDISLDTLNEERRFWAKEGDSKSREFVLRGLYVE